MCTIVVLHGLHPEYGSVVAANRDEFHARPARPPEVLRPADPRVVAGVDALMGGTWMGAADDGTFVALTNQRTWSAPDSAKRSRGEIPLGMLARGPVEAMGEHLERLDATEYNAFNLMFGDARRLFVAYGRPDRPRVDVRPLGAGVHVLVNDRMGSPEFPKTDRARELVEPHVTRPWFELRDALAAMLADHRVPSPDQLPDPPPGAPWPKEQLVRLQALCTHTEAYGTRSATLLALEPGRVTHYLHAEGPPCQAPFESVTGLLRG